MAFEKQRAAIQQSFIVLATILVGLIAAGVVERLGGPTLAELEELRFLIGGLSALFAGYILFRTKLEPLRAGLRSLLVLVIGLSATALMLVNYGGFRMPDPVIVGILASSFVGSYYSRPSR